MEIQNRLNSAIGDEQFELALKILDEGADPNGLNHHQKTAMMAAAECESEDFVLLLLDKGADINKKGFAGYTPLHIAVDMAIDSTIQSGGYPEDVPTNVITALLSKGADINAKNDQGATPLDIAKSYKSKKVIEVLTNNDS